MADATPGLVCMAEIVGVHGIGGMVKLKVFSAAPERMMDYTPFLRDGGTGEIHLLGCQPHGNIHLAAIKGIADRTAAEKLRGVRLYVPRDRLPALEEGSYYHSDLAGLTAKDGDGSVIGRIVRVANFGAGDLLEIKPLTGATYFVPFTDAVVPAVDLAGGTATVIVPYGLLDKE